MPSRKSPSQRDPLARLSQAVRAGSPASMGGRVANATPVTPDRGQSRRPKTEQEAVFSTAAAPVAGQASPPYPVSGSSAAVRFRVVLSAAGTSSTTVKLYLNGTEIASVTIASGAMSGSATFAESLAYGDVLMVAATTVGTGVTGMTAIAYLAA